MTPARSLPGRPSSAKPRAAAPSKAPVVVTKRPALSVPASAAAPAPAPAAATSSATGDWETF